MTLYISSQTPNCTYIIFLSCTVEVGIGYCAEVNGTDCSALEDAGLLRYDAVSLGNRLLVFRSFMVSSSSGVKECNSNVEDNATAILRNIGEHQMTQTLQTNAYLEGMMVILLVLLTGVDSLLAAPEGPLLLLLELSAAVVAVVLFLRGTGFKIGLSGAVSCVSGAVKVRLSRQTCVVSRKWWRACDRKWQMCVCVFVCSSVQPTAVRCCTEQCSLLCGFRQKKEFWW